MSSVFTFRYCVRCCCFFIPTHISPTVTTLYCQYCHASSRLSDTPPPPPTPAAIFFINTLQKDKLVVSRRILKQLITTPSCAICYDEFKLKESVNHLPCRHWFHYDCIRRWLSLKNNCPLCRHEFPRDPDHHVPRQLPTAATMSENSTETVVQALPSVIHRRTARIRAGAMLPNRRLAER